MPGEVSQTERDKYCMISPIDGTLKTEEADKTKLKQTHRYREQMVIARKEWVGEVGKVGEGSHRYREQMVIARKEWVGEVGKVGEGG